MAMRTVVRMIGGEPAVRKGPWTLEEDLILVSYITEHGEGSWDNLARAAGLNRNGKSCRLRWLNYLRPGVRRGSITPAEDVVIRELQATLGNKWSKIAKHLPGRTDNEIKNYWRTRIQKRLPSSAAAQQQTRRQQPTTRAAAVSEGASSCSWSAGQDDGSAAAGDCWFMPPTSEISQQRAYSCPEAVAVATTTDTVIKSEGASSALASQGSSSAGDCWYSPQASYPYSSQLSSAAEHLGMVGEDASSTTHFFASDMSDNFWNAVNDFWETIPVKGAFI